MKTLKKPLLIIVILLLVIFAIPVVVLLGVDVNPYKEDLAQLVQQQTGRPLNIEGDISKSIVPWFGITINKVSLGNPEGFERKDFVKIDKFSLRVKFWALFSGHVDIDSVQLDKLELHLLQIPGKNNWTFTTASSEEPGADSNAASEGAEASKDNGKTDVATDAAIESAKGFSLDDFSLAGVKIVNANISFEDKINNLNFAANDLNLNLSHFQFGSPAALTLSLSATSQEPAVKADISMDSEININPEGKRYGGEIKKLNITVNSKLVGKQALKVSLSSQADFDAAKGLLHVPSLKINNEELKLSVTADQIQASPPGFKGGIDIAEMNLRAYMARLGIVLPDTLTKTALQKFSFNTRYLLDLDHATLRDLKLRLDNSQLSGGISHFQFAPLGVHWKLALDQFNLDDYIPPPPPPSTDGGDKKAAAAAAKPAAAAGADSGDAELLPMDLLAKLDLDGSLSINKLQARNVVIEQSDIKVKTSESDSEVTINVKSIGKGSLQSTLQLQPDKTAPKIQSKIVMSKVSAGDILQKLMNNDLVSGATIDLNSQLDTSGNSINAWKRGLNGKVDLDLKDGVVNGVNLMGGLIAKYEKYIKREFPKGEVENRTAFSEVSTSLNASKGVFTSTKLIAKSPEITADGKVKVDLPAEYLDLAMNIKGEKFPPWISGSDAENLSSVTFPFTLKGRFDNLVPDYDVAGPLKQILKNQAKKKIEKKTTEVKEKAKEQANKKLEQKKEQAKDKLKERFKKLF